MKYFDWNDEKNSSLKEQRDICFEDIVIAISQGNLLDVLVHHNPRRYVDQKIYVVLLYNYVYLVPFVEDDEKIFFKTIYPSRKLTKRYLEGGKK